MSGALKLSKLLGQESALLALAAMSRRKDDPVPPLLLHGPNGVGKRTAALAFAASLICERPDGTDACGACVPCSRVAAAHEVTALREESSAGDAPRHYPDIGYVSIPKGKTRVSIAQTRDIALSLSQQPYEMARRIYLVDPAESMSAAAANSLLKLLEEPPWHAVLILISSAPWSLPITVRSRLTALRFKPLSRETIELLLLRQDIAPAEARVRAQVAQGSLARAAEIDVEAHAQGVEQLAEGLERLAQGDPPAAIAARLSESLARDAASARHALELLLGIVRDLAVAPYGIEPRLLGVERAVRLQPRLAPLFGTTLERIDALERLRQELTIFNRNPRLTLEGAVLALAGHSLRRAAY